MAAPYRDTHARISWIELDTEPEQLLDNSVLHLDPTMFSHGWSVRGDIQLEPDPPCLEAYKSPVKSDPFNFGGWAQNFGGVTVGFSGFVLFNWLDNPAGGGAGVGGFRHGPLIRNFWYERDISGLTPGDTVTFTVLINWQLDTGPGGLFLELEAAGVSQTVNIVDTGEIWLDVASMLNDVKYSMVVTVPPSGVVTMRIGGAGYQPSANLIVIYDDLRLWKVSCAGDPTFHSVTFPYPPEEVRSYSGPLPGSQRVTLPNGETDGWVEETGKFTCDARWIPTESQLSLPENDGWEDRDDSGTTRGGWQRFRKHANRGGTFTFYPDANDVSVNYPCIMSAPIGRATLESDRTRSLSLAMQTLDGALITGYST